MSVDVRPMIWVTIENDRETTLAFTSFVVGQRLKRGHPGPVGPDHYDGGFAVEHEAQIREWFARRTQKSPSKP